MNVETNSDKNQINESELSKEKPDNYFDSSFGTFVSEIGLNLVEEFVHNDLLMEQNKKRDIKQKAGHDTEANVMPSYPFALFGHVTNSPVCAAKLPVTATTTVQLNGGRSIEEGSPSTSLNIASIPGTSMNRSTEGRIIANNTCLAIISSEKSNCTNVCNIRLLAQQQSLAFTQLPCSSFSNQVQLAHKRKSIFDTCEICDFIIMDFPQLCHHMFFRHDFFSTKIENPPPLYCNKCPLRFFTDQGLERHMLGIHGLVTCAMEHAAKNKRDAGKCLLCRMDHQWNLLDHYLCEHNKELEVIHIFYKCTTCSATFSKYYQFKKHEMSVHINGAECNKIEDKIVRKKFNDSHKPIAKITTITVPEEDRD